MMISKQPLLIRSSCLSQNSRQRRLLIRAGAGVTVVTVASSCFVLHGPFSFKIEENGYALIRYREGRRSALALCLVPGNRC